MRAINSCRGGTRAARRRAHCCVRRSRRVLRAPPHHVVCNLPPSACRASWIASAAASYRAAAAARGHAPTDPVPPGCPTTCGSRCRRRALRRMPPSDGGRDPIRADAARTRALDRRVRARWRRLARKRRRRLPISARARQRHRRKRTGLMGSGVVARNGVVAAISNSPSRRQRPCARHCSPGSPSPPEHPSAPCRIERVDQRTSRAVARSSQTRSKVYSGASATGSGRDRDAHSGEAVSVPARTPPADTGCARDRTHVRPRPKSRGHGATWSGGPRLRYRLRCTRQTSGRRQRAACS